MPQPLSPAWVAHGLGRNFSAVSSPPQIALRHTGADDAQLAGLALRHRLLLLIQHQHAVLGSGRPMVTGLSRVSCARLADTWLQSVHRC